MTIEEEESVIEAAREETEAVIQISKEMLYESGTLSYVIGEIKNNIRWTILIAWMTLLQKQLSCIRRLGSQRRKPRSLKNSNVLQSAGKSLGTAQFSLARVWKSPANGLVVL